MLRSCTGGSQDKTLLNSGLSTGISSEGIGEEKKGQYEPL